MQKNHFEWGFEKLEFKPLYTGEVTIDFVKRGVIPIMFVVILITAMVWQSFIIFVAGMLFVLIFCTMIFLLTYIDKARDNVAQDLKERRTECIQAQVVEIQYEEEADYDYVCIICRAVSENGLEKKFRTRKVIGRALCKEGEYIDVFVEPDNYDNYEIDITKCIE